MEVLLEKSSKNKKDEKVIRDLDLDFQREKELLVLTLIMKEKDLHSNEGTVSVHGLLGRQKSAHDRVLVS